MSELKCEIVRDGHRGSEMLADVKDVRGKIHSIRVERAFLTDLGNDQFSLPMAIVAEDRAREMFLVEFDHEPETGQNRIWVYSSQMTEMPIGASP